MILGFTATGFVAFVAVSLLICITVCTLAMEASVLFIPAFVVLFPLLFREFPEVTPNEAIGLAITVEFFGYTSSVTGYWIRRQIDFSAAGKLLVITVPLAVAGRVLAYFVSEDGLLLLFAVLLLALAVVIHRAYRDGTPHGCLLCGDSFVGMDRGDGVSASSDPDTGDRRDGAREYRPRTRLFTPNPEPGPSFSMGSLDRVIAGSGGVLAGLVGIAIGEISNTFLTLRKRVPLKISTGTSALVLHLTILAALGANLLVLASGVEAFRADEVVIPWKIAAILAPVVIVGGQIGAFLNHLLEERTIVRALVAAYGATGLITLATVVLR